MQAMGAVRAYISSGSTPAISHFNFKRVQAYCRGFCLKTGYYGGYDISEKEPACFCGTSKHILLQDSTSIITLELLGMMMSAYVLVMVSGERLVGDRGCGLLRADNEAVVHWVRRCREG